MAGSKAVAEREAAQVPDLVQTPALAITAEDVVLPRIKIGQFMSAAVQDQIVKPGQLYATVGQDDPDPTVIGDEFTFYVLGLRKGKSYSPEPGAPLERYDFDDPDAPAAAWVTYDYTMALPEEDAATPYKMLLTKTGRPAAQQLNTILVRASAPQYSLAFRMTVAERSNNKGKFYVPRVAQVESTPEHLSIVVELAKAISAQPEASMGSGTATPEI